MWALSSENENIFVCDDVFTKYVSVKHLVNESNHKPNEL